MSMTQCPICDMGIDSDRVDMSPDKNDEHCCDSCLGEEESKILSFKIFYAAAIKEFDNLDFYDRAVLCRELAKTINTKDNRYFKEIQTYFSDFFYIMKLNREELKDEARMVYHDCIGE